MIALRDTLENDWTGSVIPNRERESIEISLQFGSTEPLRMSVPMDNRTQALDDLEIWCDEHLIDEASKSSMRRALVSELEQLTATQRGDEYGEEHLAALLDNIGPTTVDNLLPHD